MTNTPTVRAALAELVALKDLKARVDALHKQIPDDGPVNDTFRQWDEALGEYMERKPLAWAAARAALAVEPAAPEPMTREWCKAFPGAAAGIINELARRIDAAEPAAPVQPSVDELRGLDTDTRVRFYEHDFYVLSNFSAFTLYWRGLRFHTSEAAYHFEKFPNWPDMQTAIHDAPSAHEAFKIAERNKVSRRPDWDAVKVDIMRNILRAKVVQHGYVHRKLLATGDRELVEDSWRDDFWGWGPNRDGKNMLGKLWMEVRAELRAHNIGGSND